MKKTTVLLIALLTVLCATTGCGAKNAGDAATPAPTAEPTAAVSPESASAEGGILISTKPKTVTTEMEQVTLLIANNTGKTYSTDYVQKLEKLEDGQWREVPLTTDAVSLALLIVPTGEITDYTFDFAYHYEPLTKGAYRITKTFVDDAGNPLLASCEFDMF